MKFHRIRKKATYKKETQDQNEYIVIAYAYRFMSSYIFPDEIKEYLTYK